MKRLLTSLNFLFLVFATAQAQPQPGSSQQQAAVRVFIDCRTRYCDLDYFRTEITFIDHVRDQEDANVHVLITTQPTGGGTEFTLNFIGRNGFEDLGETLITSSGQTDTDDEIRNRLVRVIRAGLVPYINRTPLLERITVFYNTPQDTPISTQPVDDPWNFWIFRTSLSGNANGEDRFNYNRMNGSITASRTTEDWKMIFHSSGSRTSQTFTYANGIKEKDVQENYNYYILIVKSLTEHWSAGLRSFGQRSTRSNFDLSINTAPAIEYNIFPYSESTRKQFTIQYAIDLSHFNYTDSTIFNKMEETLLRQSLGIALRFNQPWGEVNTSMQGAHFLHDASKFNLQVGGEVGVRIFRGLSLNGGGYVTFVRDQLNLARGFASNEDVLLKRKELATDWRYFISFGVSYTFGSIYNNIVNPRFRLD